MSEIIDDEWLKKFRKLSTNIQASDINRDQINIFLCGPPGHGKSSTGNSILGSSEFSVSADGDTETPGLELKSTTYENYKVKVVDSPPAPREKPSKKNVLKSCGSIMPKLLRLCPKGLHTGIIVLQYGNRFYEEEEYAMAMLKEMCGQQFVERHCICVISHGDMFNKAMERSKSQGSPLDFNSWCKKHSPTSVLGKIFAACEYRCVLFDNFTNDMNTKKVQVQQLMSMIIDSWPKRPVIQMVSVNPNMRIRADIHILIETAPSYDEYQCQLKFAVNYTRSYKLSSDTARACVMIFGKESHMRLDFTKLATHEQLVEALYNAPFLNLSSGTDKALRLAREESFSSSGGTRRDVKQMVVMVTEGRTTDERQTIEEANQLKSSGAGIIVIGVASVNRTILVAVASDPDNVSIADTYEELQELPKEITQKTARAAPLYEVTADILFILDSSGSISAEDYQRQLDFVVFVINNFNIGRNEVLFSGMVFSCNPQMLFDFTLTTHSEVIKKIKAAPHMRGGTDTAAALDLARTDAFTTRRGCRGGKKIAIIITDGGSNDIHETVRAAEQLRESGVMILAVGVGDINLIELQHISTIPDDVYTVDNYSVILKVEAALSANTRDFETAMRRRVSRPPLPDREETLAHMFSSYSSAQQIPYLHTPTAQDYFSSRCIIS